MRKNKKKLQLFILSLFFCISCFCQINQDSLLIARGEHWIGKPNNVLFGLSKPEFGTFKTLEVTKIDTPTIKSKATQEGFLTNHSIKGKSTINKIVNEVKTKYYQLLLGSVTDSITIFTEFSIITHTQKEKQTFLGFLISGSNEGQNKTLNSYRDITGAISIPVDTLSWSYSLEHLENGILNYGYLNNNHDSLIIQSYYNGLKKGFIIKDQAGNHYANLTYGLSKIEIWIRKDISAFYQKAIAALFAVIVSI